MNQDTIHTALIGYAISGVTNHERALGVGAVMDIIEENGKLQHELNQTRIRLMHSDAEIVQLRAENTRLRELAEDQS